MIAKRNLKSLDYFTPPLNARYGNSSSAEEYLYKAQVGAYESHRAMFEAYSRNKYKSTGLIHWMLNNPWPSMIWHMFDYYFNQGGSYFGIKTALRPLHATFSPVDNQVWLINSLYVPYYNIKISYDIYDLTGKHLSNSSVIASTIEPDSSQYVTPVNGLPNGMYLLRLQVLNHSMSDSLIEESFYWYNNLVQDELLWSESNFYQTPCSSYADLTELSNLPEISNYHANCIVIDSNENTIKKQCTIQNIEDKIAFFVHLRMVQPNGDVVAPIFWEDNMFTILPRSSKVITVSHPNVDADISVEFYNNVVN